jgi:hypothetical protein
MKKQDQISKKQVYFYFITYLINSEHIKKNATRLSADSIYTCGEGVQPLLTNSTGLYLAGFAVISHNNTG